MPDREKIDWENLGPLPVRKRQDGATREDLAARKFNLGKAKHKGRNHITNQKRRQIVAERTKRAKSATDAKIGAYRRFKSAVREYWLGLRDEHP